jgi:hypothetical protein
MPGNISAFTRVFDALWPGMTRQLAWLGSANISRASAGLAT